MKHPPQNESMSRVWHHIKQTARHARLWLRSVRSTLASRFVRRSRHKELDWTQEKQDKKLPLLSFSRGFVWYAVLFVAALLFTQILRSRASNLFFWFMLLLLPALLLYTLTARAAMKVYLYTEFSTVEKQQPCPYEFRISNSGIFSYPFVDAIVRVPREDAVRTSLRSVRMSLPPLSSYSIANEVTFRFRGTYEIGVSCFYVYDFFRIIRMRVDVEEYHNVLVLPRKQMLQGEGAVAVSDTAQKQTRSPYAFDRVEVRDVRDYRMGDALKDVHWKLSSKAEELLVRDYSSGASSRTIIYCDLSACYPLVPPKQAEAEQDNSRRVTRRQRKKELQEALLRQEEQRREKQHLRQLKYEAEGAENVSDTEAGEPMSSAQKRLRATAHRHKRHEATELFERETAQPSTQDTPRVDPQALADPSYYADMNEYCADGVVELAISIVLRELRAGNRCMLMWFDARAELGAFGFELDEERDFDAIYRLFSTAPLCSPADHSVGKLRSMLGDTQGVKQVFVSAALDRQSMTTLCELPGMTGGAEFGSVELVYYSPEERFLNVQARRAYLESCRVMLGANGILMVDGSARLSAAIVNGREERL
ncbi:MAG: DUF58 domain-containing protein [Clostridia bacterium]|nr:DUF58 domain-containing protein [Clostridia bacterium]